MRRTKDDLIRILGIPEEKISVTYLGNSLAKVKPSRVKSLTSKRYLLYVGGRAWYKNFPNLVKAFARSGKLKREYQIVCFGGGRFSDSETELIAGLKLTQSVVQIDGDDSLLAGYYAGAVAHVCPSLYEGFGLTLVEAMSFDIDQLKSCGVAFFGDSHDVLLFLGAGF